MAITVNSPHSGKPVKVREEDLGRALRDEGGRIFYALATEDGQGVYAAVTRKGSAEEQTRYQNQQWRLSEEQLAEEAKQRAANSPANDVPHDATGPGRKAPLSRYVLIAAAIVLLAAGGFGYYHTQYYSDADGSCPFKWLWPAKSNNVETTPALDPATRQETPAAPKAATKASTQASTQAAGAAAQAPAPAD